MKRWRGAYCPFAYSSLSVGRRREGSELVPSASHCVRAREECKGDRYLLALSRSSPSRPLQHMLKRGVAAQLDKLASARARA
jgi:hypothetical protein